MKVINLAGWSGHEFNFLPGQLIDLPDAIAQDRLDAGLVRLPTQAEAAGEPSAEFRAANPEAVTEASAEAAEAATEAAAETDTAHEAESQEAEEPAAAGPAEGAAEPEGQPQKTRRSAKEAQ